MTETTTLTAQKLLDQILGTGQELVKKAKAADTAELTAKGKDMFKQAEDALADKLGVGDDADSRKKLRLGAAATAGALALVLGNRSKRKFATLGGLGALGFLAYKAQQAGTMPKNFQDVVDLINNKAPADRSEILLDAMVAAAKADGDVSNEELVMLDKLDGVDADDVPAALPMASTRVSAIIWTASPWKCVSIQKSRHGLKRMFARADAKAIDRGLSDYGFTGPQCLRRPRQASRSQKPTAPASARIFGE